MRHPDTLPLRAPKSLRWALLALALVAIGALTLAPRLSSTGHAAAVSASKNVTVASRMHALRPAARTPVFTLTSPTFEANGPLPASAAFNQPGCVGTNGQGQNIPPTLKWKNGQSGFTGFPTLSYALTMVDYDAPVGGVAQRGEAGKARLAVLPLERGRDILALTV
ncbi:MAG TPA: hypothetical protein VJQ45_08615, partial [Ktedonobacterales bacterium]|nr:hypothetical protein [Ktedonobacterales bacterium]